MMKPLPHMTAQQLKAEAGPEFADVYIIYFEVVAHFCNQHIDAANSNLRWLGLMEPDASESGPKPLTREQFVEYVKIISESNARQHERQGVYIGK